MVQPASDNYLQSRKQFTDRQLSFPSLSVPCIILRQMTEIEAVLDAEFRALIRSLHKDTVETVLAVESWWTPECFQILCMEDSEKSRTAAESAEERWRTSVQPRLLTLVHGHPDPDVRDAADFLEKRLWSIIILLDATRRARSDDETTVAIHLVHDGFTRLHRAAYLAPFRVSRPVPRFEGSRIGATEPLPGEILETIRRLQEQGALDAGKSIWGSGIPEGVKRLSDIFFMPEEERTARLQGLDVEVATTPEAKSDRDTQKFGFAP